MRSLGYFLAPAFIFLLDGTIGLSQTTGCPPADSVQLARIKETKAPRTDRLTIPVATGDSLILAAKDHRKDTSYSYKEFLPEIDFHLVLVLFYEGAEWALIHRCTGTVVRLVGPPLASPDTQRFVAISSGIMAGFSSNEIQIFRLTGGGAELEWSRSVDPRDWGPVEAEWLDPRRIRVVKEVADLESRTLKRLAGSAIIELHDEGWVLRDETQ